VVTIKELSEAVLSGRTTSPTVKVHSVAPPTKSAFKSVEMVRVEAESDVQAPDARMAVEELNEHVLPSVKPDGNSIVMVAPV